MFAGTHVSEDLGLGSGASSLFAREQDAVRRCSRNERRCHASLFVSRALCRGRMSSEGHCDALHDGSIVISTIPTANILG